MKTLRWIGVLMTLAAAVPLAAQDVSPSDPTDSAVGPSELSNFSLNGQVTREADRPTRPAPTAESPPAARPEPSTSSPPPARSSTAAETSRPSASAPGASANRTVIDRVPTLPPRPSSASTPVEPAPAAPPRATLRTDAPGPEASSLLPWLAALLLAAGAVAIFVFRKSRGTQRYASTGPAMEFDATPDSLPASRPAPPAAAPAPRHDPVPGEGLVRRPLPTHLRPGQQAAAPPAAPVSEGGLIKSSLRPWIDVELDADRALVDDQGAAIAFNVTLVNSGSAPAREVSIDACLLNAGVRQDHELSDFFQKEREQSDTIPVIAPMARVPLRTAVRIPRDQVREYEVEGRKLFMPLVAVSTRYRWSSGEGHTGAGFLIGQGREDQERLAPLRTDQGARSWQRLGVRRYEKGLRR